MRKVLFTLAMAIISLTSYSQTDTPNDSISPTFKLKIKPATENDRLKNYLNIDRPVQLDSTYRLSTFTPLKKEVGESIDFVVPTLKTYKGPPLGNEVPPLNPHFPFAENYAYAGFFGLSDRLWATSLSTNQMLPSVGRIRTVNLQLNYQLTDWMYVSGGPYASKYSMNVWELDGTELTRLKHYNDFGVTGSMKFIATDRIHFNAYGQYSINAKDNRVGASSVFELYPHTYYGGTMEFKISEKFGIEAGMLRELNPFTGKWENKPIIIPKFY